MRPALVRFFVRETSVGTVLFAIGFGLLHVMFSAVMPSFQKDVTDIVSRLAFVQQIFAALLGTDPQTAVGPAALSVMPWAHPLGLALVWTHAIMICTRVPAGEVERGTIDWLLSLPLTRTSVYLAHTMVWVLSGVVLIAAGLGGSVLGEFLASAEVRIGIWQRCIIGANLLLLYLVVGAAAGFFSAASDRRAWAVGASFAVLLGSFVFNVLSTFSPCVRRFDFLGILSYYRPLRITNSDAWPVRDMLVLIAVAAVFWVPGWFIFSRRDLRAP